MWDSSNVWRHPSDKCLRRMGALMRIAVDQFSASKRALIKDFQLDQAGPAGRGADGKIGVEDVDQIDKALKSSSLSSGQRAQLLSMRAAVTRRPEADAAIAYV